ncbi:MAG TPA: hypothetical protein VGV07_21920 [Devosia sp.]|jgi:membrane protein YdbS with pleckstrin-like domain|uniref:hypothetical protein n=1 Tax=Devosia sp. TaxID=1871048 RepID=UPI002DDD91A3|nr:hypothetical protein [Devosia sp.]HEV2517925.1 hypothetical protein [Devosia sp.]
MDWASTVNKALTNQLIELSMRQADRAMTYSGWTLGGVLLAGVSVWRALSDSGWWWLSALAGVILFVASATLWINAKVEVRYLDRQLDAVDRNWPSAPIDLTT